ncbi:uncharacterized protein PFL1_02964 [Pseudozyma flocculosa PF-1]|uniref:MADS-box domain-containing protein n=1 Tax=Pseudozyma flocculosa PF-1 TaxID=1277687 RepID=A0A061HCH7_9BASI|nr:uncharacterized protein PFL1_02964 [Pseudozyma flocculosa PF-1]EPQ29745.1 hypothetical protein PFL1_02964 [Pseudozyma flocculosa PF-1]
MGVMGVVRSDSPRNAPIYDVPYGSVQLASTPASSGLAGFDLAAGFGATAAAGYAGADYDDDEEGDNDAAGPDDDDEGSSDDGSSKLKGAKGKAGGSGDSSSSKGGGKGKKGKTEAKGEKDAKTGRRKIKIEFIEDDARRHITFSKRKAGIMKKAYELATLTGTQVLLLVVSQTGLVYTFTTPKLQALVTQAEGRNLIQACLNAPDPVGGSGDGSDGGRSPGDEGGEDGNGGSQDDHSRPGSSGGASAKGRMRPAKAGEIMTGPNTGFKKRPRNNSTSKATSMSSSSGGPQLAGVLEHTPSTADALISPSMRGDQLQMMQQQHQQQHQHHVYGQLDPSYAAYNPLAYLASHGSGGGSGDPHPFGAPPQQQQQQQQHHQQHHVHHQHQHSTGSIGGMSAGDGAMAWNGGMSPHNSTQPLFGMSPASTAATLPATDRNGGGGGGGYGYNLAAQQPHQQQHHSAYATHRQHEQQQQQQTYPHMLPPQEVAAQEQRW